MADSELSPSSGRINPSGGRLVAAPTGPTVRRMQLGWELKRLREKAGFDTRAKALEGMRISESKLYRVEKGYTTLQAAAELKDLLTRYGVTSDDDVDFLVEIQRDSLKKGWWAPYRSTMPSGMVTFVGLEYGAHAIRAWQPSVVYGLLQTENYAREMFLAAKLVEETTTEFIERNVQLRMERKARLEHGDLGKPLNLWLVLDEAALRRVIGGPEVMREQYAELIRLAQLDNVTIQILPMSTATYRSGFNFALLDFEAPLPTVVQEDVTEAVSGSDTDTTVWAYSRRFDALRAGALPIGETPKFLNELSREMRNP